MAGEDELRRDVERLKEAYARQEERIRELEQRVSGERERKRYPFEEGEREDRSERPQTAGAGSGFNLERNVAIAWFGRIGILALVLAAGFFIKYAIDNNWIGFLGRILTGTGGGVVLAVAGYFVAERERYVRLGNLLMGGGIAIAYFSIYSSYHFEAYRTALGTSLLGTIALLSVVVVAGVGLAIRNGNRIMAAEAIILGFITTGLSAEFQVLTLVYVLLLSGGLLALSFYQDWDILSFIGFAATYLIFTIWYFSGNGTLWIDAGFLVAYAAIYGVISANNVREPDGLLQRGIYLLNGLLLYVFLIQVVGRSYPELSWAPSLAAGVAYLAVSRIPGLNQIGRLSSYSMYLGVFFLFWTASIKFGGVETTAIWAGGIIALSAVSYSIDRLDARYITYGMAALLAAKLGFIDASEFVFSSIGVDAAVYLAGIVSLYVVFAALRGNGDLFAGRQIPALVATAASAETLLLIGLLFDGLPVSVLWTVFSLGLLGAGFLFSMKTLRVQGIGAFAITIFKVFLIDTSSLDIVGRTISLLVLGVILIAASFAYLHYQDEINELL